MKNAKCVKYCADKYEFSPEYFVMRRGRRQKGRADAKANEMNNMSVVEALHTLKMHSKH